MRAIELWLNEAKSKYLKEDEQSSNQAAALDILAELGIDGKVAMSLADMFDMTGTPYPEGASGDFFTVRRRTVGHNPGDLSPAMANLFREWEASDRRGTVTLPTIEEWAEENGATLTYGTDIYGNPMTYDHNHGIVDGMWKMAGESWDFVGSGVVAGTAEANDWIARRMGLLNDGEEGLRDFVEPFVQFTRKVADSNYALMDQQARDNLEKAEQGITSIDDIWGAITGQRGITGEGLALMVAGEIPSEMAAVITLGYGKVLGLVGTAGLNMTEAMGFAGESMDERIKQMWDEGVFQKEGTVLSIAQTVFPGDEAAQLRYIQDRAKNSTLMAIGAVAGVGDTIGDAMAWTGLGKKQVQSWGRRLILGAMAEGGQEGAEQFLENLGIQRGTGVEVDLLDGVTNAIYQGVVVQGGVQALGTGANGIDRGVQITKEQIRNSQNPTELLLRARNARMGDVLDNIKQQFGPDATLASVFDNIPRRRDLTIGQRRRLSRTGSIEVNGRRITASQIESASDPENRRALAILQFGKAGEDNNISLDFEKIDNLALAARTFGISPNQYDLTDQRDVNRLARDISEQVNLNVDVTKAISTLEVEATPVWSSLSETQKMQLLNRGWTETDSKTPFELEDVARASIESGDDGLPDAKYFNDLRVEILGPQADTTDADTTDTSTIDANVNPEVEITADNTALESPIIAQTEVTVPEAPSNDIKRETIVYNAMLRIANGNMDPAVIESMLNNLESDNPGITDEILKGRDINDVANLGGGDPEIMSEIPTRPETDVSNTQTIELPNGLDSTGKPRPPRGAEIELNGVTHRFLGRMWAEVKADGTLGSTGAINSETQRQLSDMAISQSPVQPSTAGGDPSDTSTADFTPSTPVDPAPNQVTPSDIFDPTAETPIDAQFADVEVPQSVRDEYADVVATRNGIKIMQFLDSQPQNVAAKLRYDGIEPVEPNTTSSDASGDPSDTSTADFTAPSDASGDPSDTSTADFTTPEPEVEPEVGSGRGDGQIEVDARKRQQELIRQAQQRIRDAETASTTDTTVGSGRGDGQAELDARRQEIQRRIRDAETASTDDTSDASGDPSDTSTADFTTPTDASGDPSDTSTADFTTPEPEVGSGRGDGQAEVDARQAQMQADAKARQAELFRQAQERIRNAEVASQNATTATDTTATDTTATDTTDTDTTDTDTTDTGQEVEPEVELEPELDTAVDTAVDTDTKTDTAQEPTPISTPATDTKTDTTTAVAPTIATAVAPTVATNTNGNRKPKTRAGALGGGSNTSPKDASQMKFTPINIRDPENWKRFRK
jgi:hypothetical protein